MKKVAVLLLGLTLTVLLAACGKQPTEEINAMKASVDAAVAEGAVKYTPDDLKAVNDQVNAAMEEVKLQDGKLFKNYDKAKELLTKAQTDAAALTTKVATAKEELRNQAVTALNDAAVAVTDAKGLLENAPKGKGSLADIEMMKADVAGLETALQEVQPLIDSGDYALATDKAATIREKAGSISMEIRTAQEKIAALQVAPKAKIRKK
jgi:major membrane immunogen (membrane-anchored lipoprotein)